MLRDRVPFVAAAALAAATALLTPDTGSAQYFRPSYGGFYGGYPGMGYYNPYPFGRFPTGTTFYTNPANFPPPYNYSPYNSAYYPPNTAATNPAPARPYQPSIVEYNTNPSATGDTNKDKPAATGGNTDSDTPYRPKIVEYNTKAAAPAEGKRDKADSSPSAPAGRKAVIREYNVPKEAMAAPQKEEPAKIDVEVPAGAEVYCDGAKTTLTGAVRKFVTPNLTPNSEYYYEFRAEWKDGERKFSSTKRVRFHAGDHITVSFLDKPATTGDLPEPKTSPR